jgi:hypothetical protein
MDEPHRLVYASLNEPPQGANCKFYLLNITLTIFYLTVHFIAYDRNIHHPPNTPPMLFNKLARNELVSLFKSLYR